MMTRGTWHTENAVWSKHDVIKDLKRQKSMNSVRKILRENGIHFTEPYENFIKFEYDGIRYTMQRRTCPSVHMVILN